MKRSLKKDLPGLITIAAYDNWPLSKACRHWSLSSFSSKRVVSMDIPRNVRVVDGPSMLCNATGIPRRWNSSRAIDSANAP